MSFHANERWSCLSKVTPMLCEKFQPPEKRFPVDEVTPVTCIPIFPRSTNEQDESKAGMDQSLKFPSLRCPMTVSMGAIRNQR